jgi:selenocysteine lyase/cysteine desulfurase
MTVTAAAAVRDYVSGLATGNEADVSSSVRTNFAELINANHDEITYAPSTTLGENLITTALGMPASGGQIITDALHFIGSFIFMNSLRGKGWM